MKEREILEIRHEYTKAIREFFYKGDYLEVETPSLVKTSPPDPHIDPVEAWVGKKGPFYLHTSPEVHMKRLLGFGRDRIFQICKVFRVEELEEIHNVEFTMLEWYREGTYEEAMKEVEALVCFAANALGRADRARFEPPFAVYDLDRLFVEKTGVDPFPLDRDALVKAMGERGFRGIDERDEWSDLFFKLLIQEVEGAIRDERPYFIKDWPQAIPTMAKSRAGGKVERFELYINGVEIANGYTELIDPVEQRARFLKSNLERVKLGKKEFPPDETFLEDLSSLTGSYTGVALGMDRLLMSLLGLKKIEEVMIHRFRV
ncbi:MAG TPA: EF-P lysine aminoacylase EpmA [Syntrophorhabdaceae bacterium]|jgi:lysyl-tRNA synthetase class 2